MHCTRQDSASLLFMLAGSLPCCGLLLTEMAYGVTHLERSLAIPTCSKGPARKVRSPVQLNCWPFAAPAPGSVPRERRVKCTGSIDSWLEQLWSEPLTRSVSTQTHPSAELPTCQGKALRGNMLSGSEKTRSSRRNSVSLCSTAPYAAECGNRKC